MSTVSMPVDGRRGAAAEAKDGDGPATARHQLSAALVELLYVGSSEEEERSSSGCLCLCSGHGV